MKLLVISDSHGKRKKDITDLVLRVRPAYLIHCGDGCDVPGYIGGLVPGCDVIAVKGNCDRSYFLEEDEYLRIGKYKILITHGHNYGVKYGMSKIKSKAVSEGCNVVMFGHTHRALIDIGDDVTLLNPGSIGIPRAGADPTFLVMEIDDQGEAHYSIGHLKKNI